MSEALTRPAVADLLRSFLEAGPDRLETPYHRLVGALWDGAAATGAARPAVPALIAQLDRAGDDRRGYLIVLLGLLADAEYPDGGEVTAAVREGLDHYLRLLDGRDSRDPLTLALLYLLGHFPDDREAVLAAVRPLALDAEDLSRLDRCLQRLDPAHPVLGQVWPAPSVWTLDDTEREFHEAQTRALSAAQIAVNWKNDGRTVLSYSGAKAYWAVRHGVPAPVTDAVAPRELPAPDPQPWADMFRPHAAALQCPACAGRLEFANDAVWCGGCGQRYPLANGVLDLSGGVTADSADEATADLLKKLADMPTLGIYYESVLRPAFLRIAGGNWDNAVTPEVEDRYIAEHARPVDGPVLDIAAGAGRWTRTLAETVGPQRLLALDLALPMVNVLRGRLPQVPVVLASALDLPFADASLGAVNCWNALQAFPEQAGEAIAEMGRCLRPGGTLTMLTFHWDDDPIARHFQASHYFPSRAEGMLLFSRDELRQWFADAGLSVVDESGPGSFVFLTARRIRP